MTDIEKGAVHLYVDDNYFSFNVTLAFSADGQSATGTIISVGPTLYKVGRNPGRALICTSPLQALSLTLQPAASPAKVNQQRLRPNADVQNTISHEENAKSDETNE